MHGLIPLVFCLFSFAFTFISGAEFGWRRYFPSLMALIIAVGMASIAVTEFMRWQP